MRYSELFEAKTVYDLRHPEANIKHFGADKYDYVSPSDGLFFTFHKGHLIIHSEKNYNYSSKVLKSPDQIPSCCFNALCGKVDIKSGKIVIGKEYAGNSSRQRMLTNIKELQQALRELKPYGVSDDFVVSGTPKHIPKTIGGILKLSDPTDLMFQQKSLTMFHGTSAKRWEIIQKQGLRPGNTPDDYNDLVPDYSEHNIYLAITESIAEFYGKRQAKKDQDSAYVLLVITVPDPAKLLADDQFVPAEDSLKYGQEQERLSSSGRRAGEFAYRGIIFPKHIRLVRTGKA